MVPRPGDDPERRFRMGLHTRADRPLLTPPEGAEFEADADAPDVEVDQTGEDHEVEAGDVDAAAADVDALSGDVDVLVGDVDAPADDVDALAGEVDAPYPEAAPAVPLRSGGPCPRCGEDIVNLDFLDLPPVAIRRGLYAVCVIDTRALPTPWRHRTALAYHDDLGLDD